MFDFDGKKIEKKMEKVIDFRRYQTTKLFLMAIKEGRKKNYQILIEKRMPSMMMIRNQIKLN